MNLKHVLAACLLLIGGNLIGQKEYATWYFGNKAGIDFNSGTATAITNSGMTALDNPACVSDSAGNILFYCDGTQLYDRTHTVTTNGSGLLGHVSGGHAATIVRRPGTYNLFYLFTMDAYAMSNGLRYSIVDLNLNAGLGDVVSSQKNIPLLTPASEQIVPVVHANGRDVWIITHPWNSPEFRSYLLTCNGLDTTNPVISTVGVPRTGIGDNALGEITVSPDNRHIATACYGGSYFELFDFDNATGKLSNALQLPNYTNAWGIEYSANGTKLYLTGWYLQQYVYQFDLSNYTAAAIAASQVNLGTVTGPGNPYYTGYMQRAPDDKIYIAVYQDPYLAVINNPNNAGSSCNLVDDGFYLGGKTSGPGLPDKTVVTHCSDLKQSGIPDTSICNGTTVTLGNANSCISYLWYNGSNAATQNFTTAGTYWVDVQMLACSVRDSFTISNSNVSAFNLGNDTSYCGSFAQTLSTGNAATQWSTSLTGAQITVTSPGTYWATINGACGVASDTIVIGQKSLPALILPTDTFLCDNDSLPITAITTASNFTWNTGENTAAITTHPGHLYWVEAWDDIACKVRDSIEIKKTVFPAFDLGNDTTLCGEGGIALNVPIANSQYRWNDNSTDSFRVITLSGTYSVTVSNGCGSSSDAINLEVHTDDCALFVPTAFSPNSDGVNDKLRGVSHCGTKDYQLHIYNRWGEEVFQTKDIKEGWDGLYKGVAQPMGVYAWWAEYFNYCSNKKSLVKGNFTLLR